MATTDPALAVTPQQSEARTRLRSISVGEGRFVAYSDALGKEYLNLVPITVLIGRPFVGTSIRKREYDQSI